MKTMDEMTAPERVYAMIAGRPSGIWKTGLARLAEVDPKNVSSLVARAQRYCPRGKKIEGDTTKRNGITSTRYRIVRDYSVSLEQEEIFDEVS